MMAKKLIPQKVKNVSFINYKQECFTIDNVFSMVDMKNKLVVKTDVILDVREGVTYSIKINQDMLDVETNEPKEYSKGMHNMKLKKIENNYHSGCDGNNSIITYVFEEEDWISNSIKKDKELQELKEQKEAMKKLTDMVAEMLRKNNSGAY